MSINGLIFSVCFVLGGAFTTVLLLLLQSLIAAQS